MNQLKLWLLVAILYLTTMPFSLNNWISVWMIMEISVLFLIGLMSLETNYMSGLLMMKFFIIQLLISLFFMASVLFFIMNIFVKSGMFFCLLFLFMKMGMFPFHFWVINILGKLGWSSFFILGTFIKLPPLNLSFYLFESMNVSLSLIFSFIIGSFLGINNLSIQKLLGYSSLTHLCWLILSMTFSLVVFWFYFLSYTYIMLILVMLVSNMNVFYLNQFKVFNCNKFYTFSILFLSLTLAGLPPFLGFLMKWVVSSFMTVCNLKMLIVLMISVSVLSTVFYIQLFYYFMLMFLVNTKMYSSLYLSGSWFKLLFLMLGFYNLLYFMV